MTSKLVNKFQIPENFPDILHDFAKEVVREQPKDIIDFAVEYFKAKENGTQLDYGHKNERGNSIDTNEVATNPATKTNFDIKREDRQKEDNNNNNNSIEEKEGQHSNQSEESNNESDGKVKNFINDIFKESMNIVSRSQNSIVYTERKLDEPAVIDNIKSDEQQAKDFIEDVLRLSQEEVQHIIQGIKQNED